MSKKKINNRLDKLFEDIDKEPEAKKTLGQEKSNRKPAKANQPSYLVSAAGEASGPIPEVDFPQLIERKPPSDNFSHVSSTMISTAFRTDEKSWATLKVVDESRQHTWGAEEQMLVKQVADQLSLALENARLFQEAQRRAREMTALAEVAKEISATLELQQVMERIANQAMTILNGVTCAVYVPDPEYQFLTAIVAVGIEADEIKADKLEIGKGILGNIAAKKTAEIVNDVSNKPNAVTIQGTGYTSNEHLIAAPILSKTQLSGLLSVWRVGENEEFSTTELEFLESLAQQAAIAVENARLFEETQERAEELSVLNEMARDLSAEMNTFSIAEVAFRYVNRLIDATNFYIALFDENTELLSFPLFVEKNERMRLPARKLEKGLTEHVIRTGEPLFIKNSVEEQINFMGADKIQVGSEDMVLCWLGVPLLIGKRPIGAMTVQSYKPSQIYSEHDKELMMTVASQVAIAMENARLFREAQARARREKILREITARIRATNDPEMIAKAAVRELGQALGVPTFIRLGNTERMKSQELELPDNKESSKPGSEGGL
jgi:GAF domain-containing protein